jgi:hypothetical protein
MSEKFMNPKVKRRLQSLNNNYLQVSRKNANHFFCPILFEDESTELCEAHIVNKALPDSSRVWTVQRADVDAFFGSRFESDFINIQYSDPESAEQVLSNKNAFKQVSPKLLLNDDPINYFPFKGTKPLPEQFTQINYSDESNTIQFGVEMTPQQVMDANNDLWELEIEMDLRVSAVVSSIKSAHLTFFHLLGYHYALSAGGRFVGKDILGNFYLQNHHKKKAEVVRNAYPYFSEYSTMVRPLEADRLGLRGTIEDGIVHICWLNENTIWAFIVYVRTYKLITAVLLPYLPGADSANKYYSFLSDESEHIFTSQCTFSDGTWDNHPNVEKSFWPKKGFLFPTENEYL